MLTIELSKYSHICRLFGGNPRVLIVSDGSELTSTAQKILDARTKNDGEPPPLLLILDHVNCRSMQTSAPLQHLVMIARHINVHVYIVSNALREVPPSIRAMATKLFGRE